MKTKTFHKLFVVCLLVLVASYADTEENNMFTCKAGPFVAGQNASITCNFGRDVRELKNYQYYVELLPFNETDKLKGIEVLACFRIQSGKLVCREKEGFYVKGTIGTRLTLEIPNVTSEHAGRYSCQYIPPDGKRLELCSLTVEGIDPVPPTTPMFVESSVGPVVKWTTESKTESADSVNAVLIGIFITLAVIFCIIVAILVIFLRRALKKNCGQIEYGKVEGTDRNTDFTKWWQELPKLVQTALEDSGFDNPLSLKKMSEEHIKTLNLREGHTLLLEEKLKGLPGWSENRKEKKENRTKNSNDVSDSQNIGLSDEYKADNNTVKTEGVLSREEADGSDNDMKCGKLEAKPLMDNGGDGS